MIRNAQRVVLLLALALLLVPAAAHAHLKLASSSPAQGDTVRTPLTEIRLTFTQAVDQRFTTITIVDASGREIGVGTMLHAIGASPTKEYMLMLTHPLVSGYFTVKWKTAGTDGHVVSGMFDFMVEAAPGDSLPPVPAPAATGHPPEHTGHHVSAADVPPLFNPETSVLWIATRWLNFLGLMLIVGAVSFRFLVLDRMKRTLDDELIVRIDDHTRRIAVIAAIVTLVSNGLRLWLQLGSLHGAENLWKPEWVAALLFDTGWGKAWIAQSAAALGFMIAALVKTEDRLDSWFSAAPFAIIAAATPAFSGHAAAVQQMAIVPVVDDAVHVIAASAWLGTLTVLLFAALPRVVASENGFTRAAALVNTFSPVALVMAGITVFTGAMNAFIHIEAFTDLWLTSYGRMLAVKIAVVMITATLGAYNWKVVKPRLGTEGATAHIRRSAASELAVAAIIILITAILVATPTV